MRNELLCITAAVVLAFSGVTAEAAVTTISTLDVSGSLNWIGNAMGGVATVGQTFTTPYGYGTLDSWSFWVQGVSWMEPLYDDHIVFEAYVMAWDGTKATGGILWQSGQQETDGLGTVQQFPFTPPGGVALIPGEEYVLFISSSNYLSLFNGFGLCEGGETAYDGGYLVFMNNGSNFSLLTTSAWDDYGTTDLALLATFSGDGIVPLPGAVLLTAIGCGLVGCLRRRKMLA